MADSIYRTQSRRVFATLIRVLGDFDLAEEALHDAFRAALEQWPRDGVPANPRAWLVSAGRFKAIDGIRRRSRFDAIEDLAEQVDAAADETARAWDDEGIEDDAPRLIFTCRHPALAPDGQVALTLREVCGRTYAGDWEGWTTRVAPTRAHWRSRGRSRNAGSSSTGWPSCRAEARGAVACAGWCQWAVSDGKGPKTNRHRA
jgi:DNA-directed RNA polymerase specialized sigma24 family protein